MNNKLKRKAFTIVELVIVIAVIAILAAVLIPTFSSIVKKAEESAYLQDRTNQQLQDLIEKLENPNYMTWEDFESILAEKLAGITNDNNTAEFDKIKDQINDAIDALNKQNNGLTKDQIEAIIEKALEGQLTTAQVQAIVNAALKDKGVDDSKINDIINSAIEELRKETGDTGITPEQMQAAINAAIGNLLKDQGYNIDNLKEEIATIIGKLNNNLTQEQIEAIIKEALGKLENNNSGNEGGNNTPGTGDDNQGGGSQGGSGSQGGENTGTGNGDTETVEKKHYICTALAGGKVCGNHWYYTEDDFKNLPSNDTGTYCPSENRCLGYIVLCENPNCGNHTESNDDSGEQHEHTLCDTCKKCTSADCDAEKCPGHESNDDSGEQGGESTCQHLGWDYTINEDETHTKTCRKCEVTITETHCYEFGTCSCNVKKTYNYKCNSCSNEITGCTKTYDEKNKKYIIKDSNGNILSACGIDNHNFHLDCKNLLPHNAECEGCLVEVVECIHENSTPTNKIVNSSNYHVRICQDCNENFLEPHKINNADCVCGLHVCVPTDAKDIGNGKHEVGCHYCEKTITANHSAGGPSYYTSNEHGHSATCTDCKVEFTAEHSFGTTDTCAYCLYTKCNHSGTTEWIKTADTHKQTCTNPKCEGIGLIEGNHEGDPCSICNFSKSCDHLEIIYTHTKDNHTSHCKQCGKTLITENHINAPSITPCSVCGVVANTTISNTYSTDTILYVTKSMTFSGKITVKEGVNVTIYLPSGASIIWRNTSSYNIILEKNSSLTIVGGSITHQNSNKFVAELADGAKLSLNSVIITSNNVAIKANSTNTITLNNIKYNNVLIDTETKAYENNLVTSDSQVKLIFSDNTTN